MTRGERVALITSHRDSFLGFLARRVPSDVAEDLLQDVLARSLATIETVRDDEAVLAWVYRALRNATIDHHRRTGASDRALERLAQEPEHVMASMAEEGSPCRCVLRAAGSLRPEQAKALQRVAVDGVAVKSFAEEEGITAGNAAVRLHRARCALREGLIATCGSCAGTSGRGCASCTCEESL